MRKVPVFLLLVTTLFCACTTALRDGSETNGSINSEKVVIYQMLVRLFGNTSETNKEYGSALENGIGKFADITDTALTKLKGLGVTHVWYTGVIEHATMADYTSAGIKLDDPDVIKGRAGSPYAIKDYYDVAPDLAVNVKNRMTEFEDLVARTHKNELKVIIDFIPNHVSRLYNSDAKPTGVEDFGATDDTTKTFSPNNNFYYIQGQKLSLPVGINAGGNSFSNTLKDGRFFESPAKATGNDVFVSNPSINDWFETVKLNYGLDYKNDRKSYFKPIPSTWNKMRDILVFWAGKQVDGFRCDVAEFVPVEFWSWVIPQVKKVNPEIIFIAEAYDVSKYATYLNDGGFDYLYDKVGLYDNLKKLIKNEPGSTVQLIRDVINAQGNGISEKMLRFLENHDEERLASRDFAKDAWAAVPAMVATATLSSSPVMIYFGQEVGEPGAGTEGFGGNDSRTTIFDYWGVPEHQKWMNNGRFDGGRLSWEQKELRAFYSKLLNISRTNSAITAGSFKEVSDIKDPTGKRFAYLRINDNEKLLIVLNFHKDEAFHAEIELPSGLKSEHPAIELFSNKEVKYLSNGNTLEIDVEPSGALIISF